MPIRRHFMGYPIDWRELSASIRFRQAKGRCEGCGRPHGMTVLHLGDGRWWDEGAQQWRDGAGKALPKLAPPSISLSVRHTQVVLATAHRDYNPTNNKRANLVVLCQRCHMLNDKEAHRRRLTRLSHRALGRLFTGPVSAVRSPGQSRTDHLTSAATPQVSTVAGVVLRSTSRPLGPSATRLPSTPPEDEDFDIEQRDRPLSFHWTANEDLIRSLGISFHSKKEVKACNSLLTEAVIAAYEQCAVSYSRRRSYYSGQKRYRGTSFTYATVTKSIEELLRRGLINENRSMPGQRGQQSQFWATRKLLDLWGNAPHVFDPHDIIQLRGVNKNLIDYNDTDATRRMRRELQVINEGLRSISIEVSGPGVMITSRHLIVDGTFIRRTPPELRRIFSRSKFTCNGRTYGPWQSIPKLRRPDILLNGEPSSEPDFRRMHPAMLYDQRGIRLVGDAYQVDDFERSAVKICLLVLLNAPNYQSALGALMSKLDFDRSQTERLINSTKRRHAPIADALHRDVGIKLMKLESEIVLGVLKRCIKAGIPALPIHDSLLTTRSNEGRVAEFMQESYATRFTGVNSCEINVSGPKIPQMGEVLL